MDYLTFDIETIGKPWDKFDKKSKEIFKEWAQRDSNTEEEFERALEQVKDGLPFSPFMGEVVAIAVLDQNNKGAVYFQAPNPSTRSTNSGQVKDFEDGQIQYRVGNEKDILERFWEISRHYNNFVTFGGRGFDVPYLMIRSAVNGIRPARNLLENRYLQYQRDAKHYDLVDMFNFYGAMWGRSPKLHFVAQAFGINTPKTDIEGKDVPKEFEKENYEKIARYCMDDVVATQKIFEKWKEHLEF
ncbi:MAG: hypothetical protein A3H51_02865 [Candidatus Spechtbacteria bacterium RIFCSPLOWO2_02_FULL_38_8]|uniref:Predicted 3'-5' exonuclease PolB-like domain-containing protein n=1 Tax=Candidatus Spechtbacteria bacterium RIFCSPLOWO2_02_FULL_38_8 TaxID=1802164 RepID=A0A1G2HHE0_9BACT|nr:MAG: hypothetical protein A3H51_02865 [Candidatus Spechtbacteria bacterium RIFCSPLOWO2_02_FULL_38_8]